MILNQCVLTGYFYETVRKKKEEKIGKNSTLRTVKYLLPIDQFKNNLPLAQAEIL